jgi:CubicO group peptidase (beta-lactamase class C family)
MRRLAGSVVAVGLLVLWLSGGSLADPIAGAPRVVTADRPLAPARPVPAPGWERVDRPERAGFSRARLEAVRGWLSSIDTTAAMVVVGGRSVFEYGDLAHLSYLASVRKSLLAMLYGKYVENGAIDLGRSLADLGLDDIGGLSDDEKKATVEHLLTARSGVYHPASNGGDDTASAPPRGSQPAGSYYLYNNWDFNAAGTVFEQLTGRDLYDAFEADLARPLGFQDFDRSRHRRTGDAERSKHLAYHFHLSTRDMARAGLLMLYEGDWDGRRILSSEWTRRISSLVTPLNEMNPPRHRALGTGDRWGYGYLWWVWDAPASPGPFTGAYTGMGAGGQYITVLPELDMVVAHKTDTSQQSVHFPRNRVVSRAEYMTMLHMVVSARCPNGTTCG